MRRIPKWSPFIAAAALACLLGGCDSIHATGGTWQGRLVPVDLYRRDKPYRAIALVIDSGPNLPDGPDLAEYDARQSQRYFQRTGVSWKLPPVLVNDDFRIFAAPAAALNQPIRVRGWYWIGHLVVLPDGYSSWLAWNDPDQRLSTNRSIVVEKITDADGNEIHLIPLSAPDPDASPPATQPTTQ